MYHEHGQGNVHLVVVDENVHLTGAGAHVFSNTPISSDEETMHTSTETEEWMRTCSTSAVPHIKVQQSGGALGDALNARS